MSIILLNNNNGGGSISIDDANIIKAYTSDSITNVEFLRDEDGYTHTIKVLETLDNLGNQSSNLIKVYEYEKTIVDSGTTDATTARKLEDSTQNFVTTVAIGDRVHNTTTDTWASVTAVDSNTVLSLNNDIMLDAQTYIIYDSAGTAIWVNKDRIKNISEVNEVATLSIDAAGAQLRRIKLNTNAAIVKTAAIVKSSGFSYPVSSYTAAPNTIVLAASVGDVTAKFTSGVVFTVFGEGTTNDSIYSTVSSAWDATNTTITVTETPTAATATGGRVWLKS